MKKFAYSLQGLKFGDILSELMFENNITNKALAKLINITESTICTWRNNEHGIQLSNLVKLCTLFNCSLDYLVGRTENNIKPTKMIVENFGKRIREVMKQKNVTTYSIRQDTPFGSRYFERWDKGADPKLSTLIDLANYFNCTLDELVGFE